MGNIKRQLSTAVRNPAHVGSLVKRRLFAHASHLLTRINGGKAAMPETINIYPTDRCNLNCSMCFEKLRKPRPELPIKTWQTLLNDVKRFRPRMHLSGGEPFLYQDIDALIKSIKKHNLFLAITTNGTLLQHHADVIVREKVNHLTVSIDGPARSHDTIRGVPGTYDRIITGLREIKKMRKKHQPPILRINSMVNTEEPRIMYEMLEIARSVKADYIQFLHPLFLSTEELTAHGAVLRALGMHLNYWQGADVNKPAPRDMDTLHDVIHDIQGVAGIQVRIFPHFTRQQLLSYYTMSKGFHRGWRFRCRAMWNTATLLPNGSIESCPDYIIGNCADEHFARSWNSTLMRQLRRRIHAREFFDVCRACCFFYM